MRPVFGACLLGAGGERRRPRGGAGLLAPVPCAAAVRLGVGRVRTAVVPDPPRGLAAVPQGAQVVDVADGVGALPVAVVLVGHELAVGGELLERLALEDARRVGPEAGGNPPGEQPK